MGPVSEIDSVLTADDRRLKAAREANPEWDIYRVFGGYLALPKGTVFAQSVDVDGIVEKLRRLQP